MTNNDKNVVLQIRLNKEFRDKWNETIKSKAINGSELIRQLMQQWLKENSN